MLHVNTVNREHVVSASCAWCRASHWLLLITFARDVTTNSKEMADIAMQTVPTVTFKEGACEDDESVFVNCVLDKMIKKVPSTSRFQVDRVDSIKEEFTEENGIVDAAESPVHGDKDDDSRQPYESPTFGSTSPSDTYNSCTNPYETNFKTFGKYTTEALPHMDHYRNLLSATTAMKSRPTLAELHEEKVCCLFIMVILLTVRCLSIP